MSERRAFLASAGAAMATAAAFVDAPNVIAQPKVQWRMVTAWPTTLDMLHGAALRMAKVVDEMSGGRLRIEVHPGGQLMPIFDCFDGASRGTVEAFMGTTSYWASKDPAFSWFATIPFGMNPEGMTAWFYPGDGLKLWEEAYAPFNVVPRPGPALAPQMAGWFRKKITAIGDYKGLKMRIPNLGGKVVERAGATTVLTPASGIFAALERGVIDASEWVAPHDDVKLGLHRTARYYYYPGWHEPGTTNDFGFNRKAYDALPADLRQTLDHATATAQVYGQMGYRTKNGLALERLRTEFKSTVEILQLPVTVLRDLKKLAAEVVRDEAAKSPQARKVHASFTKFQLLVGPWDHVAEGAYHQRVAG